MSPDEEKTIRDAMRLIGRSRSPRKLAALAQNREKAASEETKLKLRASQTARRERERAERLASGIVPEPKEKKKPGLMETPENGV